MSPGAGAAAPEPPSVREPKAAGAWPQAHSQGPRWAGAGVPSSAGSLNPTSPGLAARPVRTHLLLSRTSAVGPRGSSGAGRPFCRRTIRQTQGPCSASATSPASRSPLQGGLGCSSAPFGDQGAYSASQVTGNNSAIIPCTRGHWQCLKRKRTWLPSPSLHLNGYTSPCLRAAVSTQAEPSGPGQGLQAHPPPRGDTSASGPASVPTRVV